MKFSTEVPPIYSKLHTLFGVNWNDGIAIAYKDTVYSKWEPPTDILIHEEVHLWQQNQIGPDEWWQRYLSDNAFRLNQEVQAYTQQIKFLTRGIKDRNSLYLKKRQLCLDLSSPMYGSLCSFETARDLLST